MQVVPIVADDEALIARLLPLMPEGQHTRGHLIAAVRARGGLSEGGGGGVIAVGGRSCARPSFASRSTFSRSHWAATLLVPCSPVR